MAPQHISKIESGKRDPRLSSIERMAEAMGLTVLLVPETMAPEVRRYIATNEGAFHAASADFWFCVTLRKVVRYNYQFKFGVKNAPQSGPKQHRQKCIK